MKPNATLSPVARFTPHPGGDYVTEKLRAWRDRSLRRGLHHPGRHSRTSRCRGVTEMICYWAARVDALK